MTPKCILFIPVSSPSGIGEYMRSMIIANALQLRWPSTKIHFILNEKVSYHKDCPYSVHTCHGSPTQDKAGVNYIIKKINPELVIFDASGRASHFKQAKAVNAKVAFISQHSKKRSRGLKLNRLFNIDMHWVAQPEFCMRPLSLWQRTKLALFKVKSPQNIGPVYDLSCQETQQNCIAEYRLVKHKFIIFNAGSGGHHTNGILAADTYYQAAQQLQKITPMRCVVIFGSNYPKDVPTNSDVITIKTIENKDFITLLLSSYCNVITAGDTLLQCIDLEAPCVASSVSPDQPVRLKVCENERLVIPAEPTVKSLVEQTNKIMDETIRNELINKMKQHKSDNALSTIINDIDLMFNKDI